MLEESMGLPYQEIETAARERIEEYDDEMNLGREVRDAADALNHAILGAMKVARRCRQSPYDNFSHLVRRFLDPFKKSRHELKRLSWRPQRENNKPITRFVEAVDRTNFLGLIDRAATDKELACLFVVLTGAAHLLGTDWKTSVPATLKKTIDAVRKCRWDEVSLHGRPALIAKTHQDIAKRLRELAAKGVDIPRVIRVDHL
jgi:hypothetical protein